MSHAIGASFIAPAIEDWAVSVSDPELMAATTAGMLEAFEILYDRHRVASYSVAYRITNDADLAQDVVQETFLGAWRNADRYVEGRGSVRTWLLAIVRHRAIDLIRRRRGTARLPEGDAMPPLQLQQPDVWPEVAANLDAQAVRLALDSLSHVQREAIELAYFGGLTQREIAERTATPLGTVKSRIREGLMVLRHAMEVVTYRPNGAEHHGER